MKLKKSSKKPFKAPAKKKASRGVGRAATGSSRRGNSVARRGGSHNDPVLARFEQGKSIAEFIDFSVGKFVKL